MDDFFYRQTILRFAFVANYENRSSIKNKNTVKLRADAVLNFVDDFIIGKIIISWFYGSTDRANLI